MEPKAESVPCTCVCYQSRYLYSILHLCDSIFLLRTKLPLSELQNFRCSSRPRSEITVPILGLSVNLSVFFVLRFEASVSLSLYWKNPKLVFSGFAELDFMELWDKDEVEARDLSIEFRASASS